jgi:hypothetical protein
MFLFKENATIFDLPKYKKIMKKYYIKFKSILNANNEINGKLSSNFNLQHKIILYMMVVFSISINYLQAQTLIAPALEWEKSYWPTTQPTLGAQTRMQSGEDWFYSITKSLNTSNVQNGYMCSGYNSFVNYSLSETTGCLDNIDVVSFKCEEFEK